MKNQTILILGLTFLVLMGVGCQKEEVSLTSIEISAGGTAVVAGRTLTLTATGIYSDDSVGALDVEWASADLTVARVFTDASETGVGILTAHGEGMVKITASARDGSGVEASIEITVLPPVLMGMTVTPGTATVALGLTQAYQAVGTYSDGSTDTVAVDWVTDDAATATVDAGGTVTGVAMGTALVEATSQDHPNLSASSNLTVVDAVPVSLTVTPDPASVDAGLTTAFTATVNLSDGTTATLPVTWASDDTNTAAVDASGTATGVAPGTAEITAVAVSDPNLTDSATLTVSAPALVSLTVQPDPASVMVTKTVVLSATGHYSDGSSTNESVTWSSDDTNTATVDAGGTVTGLAVGTANITATAVSDANVTATVALTVRPPFDHLYLNSAYHTGGSGIYRVPYAGGSAQLFSTARRFYTNGLCLSPDRSTMYLLDRYGHVDAVDMASGNMTRIYTNQAWNTGQSYVSLTADPQGNLYTFLQNGGTSVYKIDPSTGTRTVFCAINGQSALFDAVYYQGDLYVSFWGGIAKGSQGGTLQNIYFSGVLSSIDVDGAGNFVVVDTWTKQVWKMKDQDSNGFILGTEATLYADFSTMNLFGISECLVDALGQVYVAEIPGGTPAAQGIWRLNDLNQDGDCLDADEQTVWSSGVLGAASGGGNMAMK